MRKTIMITAVVLVALLALGLGFARWFDVLTIDGTVNTGTVIAELTGDYPPYILGDDKGLSSVSTLLSDSDGDGVNDHMDITIDVAYPCVDYYIPFDVHSMGTIPIDVQTYLDRGNLPFLATLDYSLSPVEPVQLHYCDYADWVLHLHLDNDAAEGATYTFGVDIDAGQYNEPNQQP